MGEGIGKAIGCLVTIAIVGVVGTMFFVGYILYNWVNGSVVKSNKRITPEIELTTDGKKVDTLFIYKNK